MQATKDRIAIMQAYVDGKAVQAKVGGVWCDFDGEPSWRLPTGEYRVKPLEPDSINWDHVAPAYRFMARDEDGTVWIYKAHPGLSSTCWSDGGTCKEAEAFASFKVGGLDWKFSLVERPEASA